MQVNLEKQKRNGKSWEQMIYKLEVLIDRLEKLINRF
jgi:hypothetical protein